jgi:hypothetical protein
MTFASTNVKNKIRPSKKKKGSLCYYAVTSHELSHRSRANKRRRINL